ncbi:MAG: hypothetical protein Unbinned400contig1002_46, partial [Prokaryotic dsDNA virus sp.]
MAKKRKTFSYSHGVLWDQVQIGEEQIVSFELNTENGNLMDVTVRTIGKDKFPQKFLSHMSLESMAALKEIVI